MSNLGGLGPKALLLGRLDRPGRDESIGAPAAGDGLVTFDGDSHLLTIAPNRSGRDRSCLIPNLLAYTGSAVVVDLTGEVYAATAEARRGMGHAVVRLDPFAVTGPEPDALNPLDLLDGLEAPALEPACQDIADLLPIRNSPGDAEGYEAFGLLSAVVGYLSAVPEKWSFDQIYPTLHSDDVVYSLAVVLDTIGKKIPKLAYSEISAWLQKEERVRSQILSRITSYLHFLGNLEVQKSLSRSSIPLSEIFSGAPVTVYIVIPAEKLATNSALLRIWIGTLLYGALRSPERSSRPTLFLLDHCAELGTFPLLESLLRVESRGAFRIWTFWHDVYQLRTTYPVGWPAIVSGCGAVQIFGTKDSAAAAEAEALFRLPANDVWSLGPGEQIVRLDGMPRRARKLDPRVDLTPDRPGPYRPLTSKIAR
jgi:type IV secretion system protein VirD4